MESAAIPTPDAPQAAPAGGVEDKGLKKNAIGFVSSVVIGVASTAPGYSLAATLGFVAAAVALQSPAILLISFIPMFLVAGGYYYMNKADPDCGTSFSWVTKAMGPQLGWMAGWAIVVADVIVMANLAQIAGLYTFELGEKVLGRARAQAAAAGTEIAEQLVAKRAVPALLDVAEEQDARMIVVGSFGEAPLKGIILGSTTNKLLHLTKRPVLVVPAEEK
jgi:nucleotide-binding universal stress UspA family protein